MRVNRHLSSPSKLQTPGVVSYMGKQYHVDTRNLFSRRLDDDEESDDEDDSRRRDQAGGTSCELLVDFPRHDVLQEQAQQQQKRGNNRHSRILGSALADPNHHQDYERGGSLHRRLEMERSASARRLLLDRRAMMERTDSAQSLTGSISHYVWGNNNNSRRNNPSSSLLLGREESIASLSVDQNDLVDLVSSGEDFAKLKQALKRNGAVTNGVLQQGLHIFVHQQRERKKRQQEAEELRRRTAVSQNDNLLGGLVARED